LEIEALLRFLFADHGSKEDALTAVRSLRSWALVQGSLGRQVAKEYLDNGGPFPERLHINVLFASLAVGLGDTILGWSEKAEAEIQQWPTTKDVGLTDSARAELEKLLARLEEIVPPELPPKLPGV
jgi:hypothetical protein